MTTPEMQELQVLFGNRGKGYLTLRRFCDAVDAGQAPPADVLQICSRAFKRILDEDNTADALMLFADALGLNKQTTRIRTAAAADAELALVIEVIELERDGMKPSQAKKEIAKLRGKSLRRIQDYYQQHKSDAEWILDNFKL